LEIPITFGENQKQILIWPEGFSPKFDSSKAHNTLSGFSGKESAKYSENSTQRSTVTFKNVLK